MGAVDWNGKAREKGWGGNGEEEKGESIVVFFLVLWCGNNLAIMAVHMLRIIYVLWGAGIRRGKGNLKEYRLKVEGGRDNGHRRGEKLSWMKEKNG